MAPEFLPTAADETHCALKYMPFFQKWKDEIEQNLANRLQDDGLDDDLVTRTIELLNEDSPYKVSCGLEDGELMAVFIYYDEFGTLVDTDTYSKGIVTCVNADRFLFRWAGLLSVLLDFSKSPDEDPEDSSV